MKETTTKTTTAPAAKLAASRRRQQRIGSSASSSSSLFHDDDGVMMVESLSSSTPHSVLQQSQQVAQETALLLASVMHPTPSSVPSTTTTTSNRLTARLASAAAAAPPSAAPSAAPTTTTSRLFTASPFRSDDDTVRSTTTTTTTKRTTHGPTTAAGLGQTSENPQQNRDSSVVRFGDPNQPYSSSTTPPRRALMTSTSTTAVATSPTSKRTSAAASHPTTTTTTTTRSTAATVSHPITTTTTTDLVTIEDQEPVLSSSSSSAGAALVDASVLHHRSVTILVNYAYAATHHSASQQQQQQQQQQQRWTLVPCHYNDSSSGVLRYGDTVQIVNHHSDNSKDNEQQVRRLLGVTQHVHGEWTECHVQEISFPTSSSSSSSSSNQEWMVIRGKVGREGMVRVGKTAIEFHGTTTTKPPPQGWTSPIRSGDSVVLRHVTTGGLLTCLPNGGWSVATDSYHNSGVSSSRGGRAGGVVDDPSLMGRLHRHDYFVPTPRHVFVLLNATVPPIPEWSACHARPFLEGSYLTLSSNRRSEQDEGENKVFGGSIPLPMLKGSDEATAWRQYEVQTAAGQEWVLLEELLGSFLGLEGQFVTATVVRNTIQFRLQDVSTWDASTRGLVQEILPLASAYAQVRQFVSSHHPGYEYGRVMQSLGEQMDGMLQDYQTFIAQLDTLYRTHDTAPPSLIKLQVDVRPVMHSMWLLQCVVETVRSKKGGALLNALRQLKQRFCGDAVAADILGRLLHMAAVPYMETLHKWIRQGVLDDPYEEFMVHHDPSKPWEEMYKIVDAHVLDEFFASTETVGKVLATGRFWNAVRVSSSQQVVNAEEVSTEALTYNTSASTVSSCVQGLHRASSDTLVELLFGECDLLGCLRLVKRYFLLEHGDFFVHFMDIAEEELLKELSSVSKGRIHHWLKTSIQLTEHNGESGLVDDLVSKHRDANHMTLAPSKIQSLFASESLMEHLDKLHAESGGLDTEDAPTPSRNLYGGMAPDVLTGLDAFVVDFISIPFPVSLVLSPLAMESYQLLFRHLFFTKHVERRLVDIWQDHQAIRELQSLRGALGPTFLLRQRMLHFLQQLVYYMMLEVIEPNWLELEKAINDPQKRDEQTVDDILETHIGFLRKTLEACLLTNRDLLRALTKLMGTCLMFSDQMKRFMKATKIEDDRHNVASEKRRAVRRNLNDRGGARRASLSRKLAEETMIHNVAERKQRVARQTTRVSREVTSESYQRMIARFEEVFSDNLCDFMLQLKYSDDLFHTHKVNLAIRLDYNGYVSSALGLATKSRRLGFGSVDGTGVRS